MLNFPITPDEEHEFYQFIHTAATGYLFDGNYKLLPTPSGLWVAEDSIGYRLTAEGMWVGEPRDLEARVNWFYDTSHEFKDAYELLLKNGCKLPGLRRPRVANVY